MSATDDSGGEVDYLYSYMPIMVRLHRVTPDEATKFIQTHVNKWAPVARRVATPN